VHSVLAAVDLAGDAAAVERAARTQARLLGASDAECAAARTAVIATLAHPLLRRAAASAELRRETPVLLRRSDGSLVEGVIDLAFREGDPARWTLIDFKTDRDLALHRSRYETQLRLYAEAIAAAMGEPVEPVLLVI
jgi:ATP-dependent helicase/nuclease subunit A